MRKIAIGRYRLIIPDSFLISHRKENYNLSATDSCKSSELLIVKGNAKPGWLSHVAL